MYLRATQHLCTYIGTIINLEVFIEQSTILLIISYLYSDISRYLHFKSTSAVASCFCDTSAAPISRCACATLAPRPPRSPSLTAASVVYSGASGSILVIVVALCSIGYQALWSRLGDSTVFACHVQWPVRCRRLRRRRKYGLS